MKSTGSTSSQHPIYLDNAATTPPLACAVETLTTVLKEVYGNSSSSHLIGRKALEFQENAEEILSHVFHVPPAHIVFTSGGTESNNLGIWGALGGLVQGVQWLKNPGDSQVITTRVEHDSTKRTFESLEELGANVVWLNVNQEGFIKLDELEKSLSRRTKLISIHHAQNEVGTVQDLKQIISLVRKHQPQALVHVDGVQSFLKIPFSMQDLGIDLLSVSGHKIGAPKGIGALILGERFENRKPKLSQFLTGSAQQHGIRPGTVPVPLIASFASAVQWGVDHFKEHRSQLLKLRTHLAKHLPKNAVINGPKDISENAPRSPQTLNFSIPRFPSGMLVEALSAHGICVSAGSACHSTNTKPNETLKWMGVPSELATSAMRVSLSATNRLDDIDTFLSTLQGILSEYS